MQITTTVNGTEVTQDVEPRLLLVHFLRDTLGLTGTHWGCDTSNCGTCVVLLDGRPVKSCTVLAVMTEGHEVRTVEGLRENGRLHPVQEAFVEAGAVQCGFCTPGFVVAVADLLVKDPDPSPATVREALSGNICRCTGYQKILDAVNLAAVRMRDRA